MKYSEIGSDTFYEVDKTHHICGDGIRRFNDLFNYPTKITLKNINKYMDMSANHREDMLWFLIICPLNMFRYMLNAAPHLITDKFSGQTVIADTGRKLKHSLKWFLAKCTCCDDKKARLKIIKDMEWWKNEA